MNYEVYEFNDYLAWKRVKNLGIPYFIRHFEKNPYIIGSLILIDEVYEELLKDFEKRRKKDRILADIDVLAEALDVSDTNLDAFIDLYSKRIMRNLLQPVFSKNNIEIAFFLSQTDISGKKSDFLLTSLIHKEKSIKRKNSDEDEIQYRIKDFQNDENKLLYINYLFTYADELLNSHIKQEKNGEEKKIYLLKGEDEEDRTNRLLQAMLDIANATKDNYREKIIDLFSKRYISRLKKENEIKESDKDEDILLLDLPSLCFGKQNVWIDKDLNIYRDTGRLLLSKSLEEVLDMHKEHIRSKEEIKEEFEYVKAMLSDELIRNGIDMLSIDTLKEIKEKDLELARKLFDLLVKLKNIEREYNRIVSIEQKLNSVSTTNKNTKIKKASNLMR